jgi:amidase
LEKLISLHALDVVAQLRTGAISPLDCLDVVEGRIASVNGPVNALVTLCLDRARQSATALMKRPLNERGLLCGLPLPIKDLTDVAGVRCTQGSPIYANRIAESSDILVEHLERSGGIVHAMSNTPEFGAGANTFNPVFGATRNPYDTRLSAAGSSGGAALATGMAWLAHGSDLGGSLRNPASFCGVVGLRPSPGRVAASVGSKLDGTLAVEGPMARNVADCALLLDAMCGEEAGDFRSLPAPGVSFLHAAQSGWKPRRVAVSRDLGITPVDPEVAALVLAAARHLEREGVEVVEAHPDMSGALECFQVLRALGFATSMRSLLQSHRHLLKPEVIWNIEKGLRLTVDEIAQAEAHRVVLAHRMADFLTRHDLLLCPATIVPPFPVEERYVTHCNGIEFESYVDWLLIVAVATLCACPAMSVPCGLTTTGLPVGLQVIASNRGEAKLIAGAAFIERVISYSVPALTGLPIDPHVLHATK